METFYKKISLETRQRMEKLSLLPKEGEEKEWKSSFVGTFLHKFPKYYGMIKDLKKIIGELPRWEHFDRRTIREIVNYYTDKCSQSSARTYCAMLRAILNEEKELIPFKKFETELSVKNVPSIPVYLTRKEIKKLEKYIPDDDKERIVLCQFLVSCYTGARHSDTISMRGCNVIDGKITYVSQKTKRKTTVEAKSGLEEWIKIGSERLYADSTFNATIREICRKAGITEQVRVFQAGKYKDGEKWQFVASHTARRSFASNLNELGVPLRDISMRMGHTNTIMTERYIVSPTNKLTNRAMDFFK